MVTSPRVSWLFFKAVRAGLAVTKRPYLDSYGSSEQRGKTANWPRPGRSIGILPVGRVGGRREYRLEAYAAIGRQPRAMEALEAAKRLHSS
jgi:hypothetical protein